MTTDTVNEAMESPSDFNVNNDGNDEASLPKNMTLSEEFQAFLTEPGLKMEEVQSVGAQIINKKMQLFEAIKKRPENLENLIVLSSQLDRLLWKQSGHFLLWVFLLPKLETG